MSKLKPYAVLRAICIAGESVPPGSIVELGPVLGAELVSAAKVRAATDEELAEGVTAAVADGSTKKPAEPAPRVLSNANAAALKAAAKNAAKNAAAVKAAADKAAADKAAAEQAEAEKLAAEQSAAEQSAADESSAHEPEGHKPAEGNA